MNFGDAFEQVKKGRAMRLPGWSPDVRIKACYTPWSRNATGMTAPYLYVDSRHGKVPWKETMIELFAENWEIV